MPNRKIPIAILGATGAVGQRMIQLLAGHPLVLVTVILAQIIVTQWAIWWGARRSTGMPWLLASGAAAYQRSS